MIRSYLALGDSYTIGEGVPLYESFPYQTVQMLRAAGQSFGPPEILARTGWTTDELQGAFDGTRFLSQYDLVSLLIGVNNQYRGRDTASYGVEFKALLSNAVRLAADRSNVFVLSIPDWGISPFAKGRDTAAIAKAIDAYNAVAAGICEAEGIRFIDITTHSRMEGRGFTADGLHPDGHQYHYWAQQLASSILNILS